MSKKEWSEYIGQISYMFQNNALFDSMTVFENVAMPLKYTTKLSKKEIAKKVMARIEQTELTEVFDKYPSEISGGMQKRAALARALVTDPSLLILDEPTTGLDPNQIRDIRSLIRELGESHGIILSTHILPEVQATCTRVQIIHQGRLVFAQTIQELEQRLTSHVLLLETRQPLDATGLATVPGIDDVELLGASRARLHFTDSNPADAVAAYVTNAGLGLVELALDRQTLEQVFVELTCSDRPETVEDAA